MHCVNVAFDLIKGDLARTPGLEVMEVELVPNRPVDRVGSVGSTSISPLESISIPPTHPPRTVVEAVNSNDSLGNSN